MTKPRSAPKAEKSASFVPEPDTWARFERAADAVVKAAEKEKAGRKPARIVRKGKPDKPVKAAR